MVLRNGFKELDLHRRAKEQNDMDCSKLTVRSDSSEDDGAEGRQRQLLKSCLKIRTQLESLARMDGTAKTVPVHSPGPDQVSEKNNIAVRFNSVEFRQYVRVLSDNPSTSSGPPIGIGWKFIPEDTIQIDLDLYECGCEGLRRSGKELVLPRDLRENMLREVGYSRSDIINAIRSVQKAKARRNVSFHNQKYEPIVERVESVKYCVRRLIL
jgi:hypothetical protein